MPSTGSLDHGALLFACAALATVALMAVMSVIRTRREARRLARVARAQSEGLRDLLHTARMAECIAGIGVWQYDPASGDQQWTDGLKRMFGVEGEENFVDGDAETLLFASGVDLVGAVQQHSDRIEPFVLPFDICKPGEAPRAVLFHVCNLRNADGRVRRIVAVVRDATEGLPSQASPAAKHGGESQIGHAAIAAPEDIDPLTGLASRRRFMRELDRLVSAARADETPLALVIFNIDACAAVRADHGGEALERLVAQIARIAEHQARANDFLGRVGDCEFGWVIPNAHTNHVRIMAERMRQAVARSSGSESCPPVTISIGFADIRESDSALSLFARADTALVEAAQNGRNRVRVAA